MFGSVTPLSVPGHHYPLLTPQVDRVRLRVFVFLCLFACRSQSSCPQTPSLAHLSRSIKSQGGGLPVLFSSELGGDLGSTLSLASPGPWRSLSF